MADGLAIANGTMWDSISREMKHLEKKIETADLQGGSPQSLPAICLPSQVFPQDSLPGLKRRCEAFLNAFPEVLGRTEYEYISLMYVDLYAR